MSPAAARDDRVLGRALPGCAALRQERVERAFAEVDDGVAGAEAEVRRRRRARTCRSPASQDPELLQVGHRLEEGAAADGDELLSPHACELVRLRPRDRASAAPPVELDRARRARRASSNAHAARTLRKPWRPSAASGWCRPAVALKGTPASRHAARKRPSDWRRRHLGAATAHLRAQATLRERGELLFEPVAERHLDVGLAREPVEPCLPARLHRLGPRGRPRRARRGGPRARDPRLRARPAATRARRAARAATHARRRGRGDPRRSRRARTGSPEGRAARGRSGARAPHGGHPAWSRV